MLWRNTNIEDHQNLSPLIWGQSKHHNPNITLKFDKRPQKSDPRDNLSAKSKEYKKNSKKSYDKNQFS